jgi:hypothetical protein
MAIDCNGIRINTSILDRSRRRRLIGRASLRIARPWRAGGCARDRTLLRSEPSRDTGQTATLGQRGVSFIGLLRTNPTIMSAAVAGTIPVPAPSYTITIDSTGFPGLTAAASAARIRSVSPGEPRLLHRNIGYSSNPARALRNGPEAIPEEYQQLLSDRARLRETTARRQEWGKARSRILGYAEHVQLVRCWAWPKGER